MIINNNVNSFSNLYTANAVIATKQSNSASKVQKANSFQDEMKISKDVQSFNTMLKKLRGQSEVRQDKVEEYSRKISSGSYDVKSENVAASILLSRF